MQDKVVFVTGANGGLGSSVTWAFLQRGARVIGASKVAVAENVAGFVRGAVPAFRL
jgi:NAD(P)-dependent dehydrogenase (short-subunit alcohol dehydrogenase family)